MMSMRKLFCAFLLLVGHVFIASAQLHTDTALQGNLTVFGLKNSSGKWVVAPAYTEVNFLSNRYFGLKDLQGHWGVVNPYGKVTVPFIYDDLHDSGAYRNTFPFVAVKKNGRQGIIAIDDHTIVMPLSYSSASVGHDGDVYIEVNGTTQRYLGRDMHEKLSKMRQEARRREIAEAARRREEEARRKKEKELSSFTLYAKSYVEPAIESWQQKGEFETVAEYSVRVNAASRAARISELTAEAEEKFLTENAALHADLHFTLGAYDADNETFRLNSTAFGDLFLSVPRNEAPAFKRDFAQYAPADMRYYIVDDKAAIGGFSLRNSKGKAYVYDNRRQVAYNTYEIAQDKFDLQPLPSASNQGASTVNPQSVSLAVSGVLKPKLTILSPSSGDAYTRGEVTIRYSLRSGGVDTELSVWIDGKQHELTSEKGICKATGELTLPLPQDASRPHLVVLSAHNDGGIDMHELTLHYAGEPLKPRLHLLAVGVGDYADETIPDLRLAAKDAEDFTRTVMERPNTQYSQVVAPLLLTDRQATAARVKSTLKQLSDAASQGDVVMLFFSGHGAEERNKTYFLPCDAVQNDLFTSAVKFDDIRETMEYLVSKQCRVVIFMDTCHSGAMYARGSSQRFTVSDPTIIGFFSSTGVEKSNESMQWNNGIFTKALIEGIQGAAANEKQHVTIQRLDSYIKRVVEQATSGRQSPIVENKVGDFILF